MTNIAARRAALAAATTLAVLALGSASTAYAAKAPPVTLAHCEASMGTIAIVDGDVAGWTKYNLGSPRELINAMATESGCFTPINAATGQPARFLVTAIAGEQEDVDRTIGAVQTAAVEGLVRSGAAAQVLGRVPMGGAMLGMLGGLGGKKKTIAAGLRVVSPSNGMTLATGTGSVTKSTLTFGGVGGWASGAAAAGYGSSKDGQSLTEAFMIAFNRLAAQQGAMSGAPQASGGSTAPSAKLATVAVDTQMRATPAANGAVVRALRASTTLTPTGRREGLFVEVTDSFGTRGWVSVENLR